MPFGSNTCVTSRGKAMVADRIRTTPATYSTPPKWIAAGVGATGAARTAAVGDTALSSELTEGRTAGTESLVTVTVTGDTYRSAGTVTATGTRAVDEAGMFDQLAAGGNMFASATFAVINLVSGDSVAFTWSVTFA
jgi:hypothetical protein